MGQGVASGAGGTPPVRPVVAWWGGSGRDDGFGGAAAIAGSGQWVRRVGCWGVLDLECGCGLRCVARKSGGFFSPDVAIPGPVLASLGLELKASVVVV